MDKLVEIKNAALVEWKDPTVDPPPDDGRLLLLICCFADDSNVDCDTGGLSDSRYWRTIGNYTKYEDPNIITLETVGWNWCNDHFTDGPKNIRVVRWAEYPAAPLGFTEEDQ